MICLQHWFFTSRFDHPVFFAVTHILSPLFKGINKRKAVFSFHNYKSFQVFWSIQVWPEKAARLEIYVWLNITMHSDLCILTLVRWSQILLLVTAVHYRMLVLHWGMLLWQSHLGINLNRIIQQYCITQLTIYLGYKLKLF
jgi:hypothetical protein